jgi:hypothetical protein
MAFFLFHSFVHDLFHFFGSFWWTIGGVEISILLFQGYVLKMS